MSLAHYDHPRPLCAAECGQVASPAGRLCRNCHSRKEWNETVRKAERWIQDYDGPRSLCSDITHAITVAYNRALIDISRAHGIPVKDLKCQPPGSLDDLSDALYDLARIWTGVLCEWCRRPYRAHAVDEPHCDCE